MAKQMLPDWARDAMVNMLNELDGRFDEVMVGGCVLLHPAKGFDVQVCEQTTNFDPMDYGPMMVEGYAVLAGMALAKMLNGMHADVLSPSNEVWKIEDDEQMVLLREIYEQNVRSFLTSLFKYAGGFFQDGKGMDVATLEGRSVAAVSQILGYWLIVCQSTHTLKPIEPPQEDDDAGTDDNPEPEEAPDDRKTD